MERKNKLVLTLLIALVMVAAMLASFGLNVFTGDRPEIVLPTAQPGGIADPGSQNDPSASGVFQPVEVTPDTVQNVIATLDRPDNYARTVTVEMTTGENRVSTVTAKVWVDGPLTRVNLDQAFQPLGTQMTIIQSDGAGGGGTVYRWYQNSANVKSWPAGESAPDLAQRIPTYEDVLELDREAIVDAGFGERDGLPCVYVETRVDELGYLERYWVSTDNGLLAAAETVKGDQVIMRMSAANTEVLQAEIPEGSFTLPDGTALDGQGGA